jgi:hypothetical protein
VVDTRLTLATGTAERQAALEMVADRPGNHRITLGADKAYDVAEFVADPREHNVTPHVVRTAGDRTRRRRLNKLSCAGWLPHDRGFVSGLPRSRDEQRSGDRLITGREDSPPWSCLRQCARLNLSAQPPPFTAPLR